MWQNYQYNSAAATGIHPKFFYRTIHMLLIIKFQSVVAFKLNVHVCIHLCV